MPYSIGKQGNKFVVRKKTDGKVMGKHATKKQALAQQAALYANEASEPENIAMLMEAANLETLGRPKLATHGTLWTNDGQSYLIFQPLDKIDLAQGDASEVVIYFYGATGQFMTDSLPSSTDSIVDLDEVSIEGMSSPIDTWYNPSSRAILIMPTIEGRDDEQEIASELETNGYSLFEIPFYDSVDDLIDMEAR